MSGTVDTRTVEMRFDNSDFESNVKQSMSTLEKLKRALKLDGASAGLKQVEKASQKLDFKDLNRSVDGVGKSFSALETIATGVLLKIGMSAAEAGMRITKSLTIDQIAAGWSKYEEKTTAVQTIMSNLSAAEGDFVDDAAKMEHVNKYLEKLMWFSDETSYSFTDMTSNVGKFIANGQGLDDSVTAMQGIATWAAKSGQNTQAAARAMYNISQAMGTGSMKIKDWMSIENANMATAEFKQLAITIGEQKGKIKEGQVSIEQFRDSLSGKDTNGWFDKEVMMEVFKTYGAAADKIKQLSEESGKTATEVIKDLKRSAKESDKEFVNSLGFKAFAAAQEAKTFSEAIAATSDAVSTKWMRIFENIFGNYLQQKELWTGLAEDLWDIFAAPLDTVNDILSVWNKGFKGVSGREDIIAGFKNMLDTFFHSYTDEDGKEIVSILGTLKNAFKEVFFAGESTDSLGEKLWNLTKRFREFTEKLKPSEETLAKIQNSFEGLFTAFKIGGKFISSVFKPFKNLFKDLFPKGLQSVLDFTDGFANAIKNFDKFLTENKVFESVSDGISLGLSKIGEGIDFVSKKITGLSVKDLFGKLKNSIIEFFSNFDFAGSFGNIAKFFSDVINQLKNIRVGDLSDNLTPLQNFYLGLVNIFSGIKNFFTSISPAFRSISSKINNFLTSIGDALSNRKISSASSRFQPIFDGIKSIFSGIGDFFASVGPTLKKVGQWIGEALGNIGDAIAKFAENKSATEIVESIIKGGFFISLTNLVNSIAGLNRGKKGLLEGITDGLDAIKGVLKAYQREINISTIFELSMAIGVLSASMWALGQIQPDRLEGAGNALAKIAIAVASFSAIKDVVKSITKTNQVLSGTDSTSFFGQIRSLLTGIVQTSIFANDASAKFLKVSAGLALAAIGMRQLVKAIGEIGELIIKLGKEQDDAVIKKGLRIISKIVAIFGMFALLAGFSNKTGSSLAAALAAYVVIKAIAKLINLMADVGANSEKMNNIKKFIDNFSYVFKALAGFVLAYVGLVSLAQILMALAASDSAVPGLANVLKQFGKNFERIAISLAIVAAAMYLFSLIDFKEGDIANIALIFGGFIALVGILQLAMVAVSKNPSIFKGNTLSNVLKEFGKNFERIALSLIVLDAAIWILSKIKFNNSSLGAVAAVFGGFIALVGILQITMAAVSNTQVGVTAGGPLNKILKTFGNNFLKIAASLAIVAVAAWMCASINFTPASAKAVAIIFGSFLVVVGAISALSIGLSALPSASQGKIISAMVSTAALFISVAASLLIVAKAVDSIASIDMSSEKAAAIGIIFGGFLVIVGLVSVLSGALTKGAGGALSIVASAVSYIAAAIAIGLIADSLAELATVDQGNLIGAGLVITAIIVVLGLAVGLTGINAVGTIAAAAGLLIASGAVLVLAMSLASLADVDQSALISAAVTVTLMMTVLTLLAALAGAAGPVAVIGGAAMLLASAAVLVLAGALTLLAGIDLSIVSTGLIDVGVALVPLAVGCVAAGAGIVILSVGLVAFGAAAIVAGAGAVILAAGLAAVALAVGLLGAAVTLLAAGIALLIGDFDGISQVGETVRSKFVEIKDAISEWASNLVGAVKDKISEFITKGKEIVSNIVSGIQEKISSAKEKGQEIIDNIKEGISNFIGDLVGKGEEVITNVVSGITGTVSSLISDGESIISNIKEGISNTIATLVSDGESIITNVKSGISSYIASLITKGQDIIDNVKTGITNVISDLFNIGMDIVTKIKDGISSVIGSLFGKGTDMVTEVSDGVSGSIDNATSWGSDLVSNFAAGIRSGLSWVRGAASSIASAVSSFLHHSEPDEGPLAHDHTFAPDMIKLWCKGIYDNLYRVDNSSEAFANSVADGFSSALEYVSSLIDDGMSDDLTIRPIMDLSEIQNGVRRLDSLVSSSNGYVLSGTARLASSTAYSMSGRMTTASDITDSVPSASVTNYNTYNISNNDPAVVAQKVSKLLDQDTKRAQAVWARR